MAVVAVVATIKLFLTLPQVYPRLALARWVQSLHLLWLAFHLLAQAPHRLAQRIQ